MKCAICTFLDNDDNDDAEDAVTIVEGYAVCEDHTPIVATGERFANIMRVAAENW